MQADVPTSRSEPDGIVTSAGVSPTHTVSTARSGISLTLAASADAPTLARRAAADALSHWDGERRDIALLVISELVTNAVRYGARGHADRVALSVRHRDGTTRIEVTDRRARGGAVVENMPRGSGGQRSGWGLPIVAELTDRWGVEHGPGRTCVWCEIDAA